MWACSWISADAVAALVLFRGLIFDASECRRAIEDEWAADSGGEERMGRPHFEAAWFQLADLHTKAVGAVMYAQWVLDKLHKICVTRVPTPGQPAAPTGKGYEWRSDDEIMATAAVKAAE